jgi:hypothetical protein
MLAALPVALVALVAGTVSYSHIVSLGLRTGQSPADAHLLPLAVDGLIVSGSVILLAGSWLGWLAVVPGVAATLFANLESGLPHGQLAATVATWPAIAFTVSAAVLERWLAGQGGTESGSRDMTHNSTFTESSATVADLPSLADPVPAAVPAALNGHGTAWSQPATSGWS